eukprot:3414526-Pleurochrysis_carterae.AAC.2
MKLLMAEGSTLGMSKHESIHDNGISQPTMMASCLLVKFVMPVFYVARVCRFLRLARAHRSVRTKQNNRSRMPVAMAPAAMLPMPVAVMITSFISKHRRAILCAWALLVGFCALLVPGTIHATANNINLPAPPNSEAARTISFLTKVKKSELTADAESILIFYRSIATPRANLFDEDNEPVTSCVVTAIDARLQQLAASLGANSKLDSYYSAIQEGMQQKADALVSTGGHSTFFVLSGNMTLTSFTTSRQLQSLLNDVVFECATGQVQPPAPPPSPLSPPPPQEPAPPFWPPLAPPFAPPPSHPS